MSVWDDPEIRAGGDFFKFEKIGDEIRGTVAAVRVHRFDDGSAAPQVLLTTDDGEEKTVTAGQVLLKRELAEQRPEAGDWVHIKLSEIEKRSGGKELKHFVVAVRRGNGQTSASATPAASAAAAAPAPAPAAPAAAAAASNVSPEALAALQALSPEQRAALGL